MAITKVTSGGIADGTLSVEDIADDAVTAAKLANSINTEIAANTAKVTNATHTGDVTGGTSLTITDDAVTAAKLANSINTDIATGVTGNTTANAALPKAGGAMTGTITGFTSTGIDDNADATAITINSSENVGIGTASPVDKLEVAGAIVSSGGLVSHQTSKGVFQHGGNDTTFRSYGSSAGTGRMLFNTGGGGGSTDTLRLELTADGRGLSQFTAKAWINFKGDGTIAIRDSHNVSSINDFGTGYYEVTYAHNMANTNYCAVTAGRWDNTHAGIYYGYHYVATCRIQVSNFSGTASDADTVPLLVFGD